MATVLGISVTQVLLGLALVLFFACLITVAIRMSRLERRHESRVAALEQEIAELKNEVEVLAKSSFGVGKRVLEHEKRLHQMADTGARRPPQESDTSSARTHSPPESQTRPRHSETSPASEVEDEWPGYRQIAALVKEKDQLEEGELSQGEASLLEMIRNKRANGMEIS